ncbi:MAG: hypothetical protein J1E35_05280 [Lachnospiraceae bacterium]|nr:hypothetical protein [Lachnospiraceae bacterium]
MRITKKITAFFLAILMLTSGSIKAYAASEDEEKAYLAIKEEMAVWLTEFGIEKENYKDELDVFLATLSSEGEDYLANKDEIEKEYKIRILLDEMQLLNLERYMKEIAFRETETDENSIAAEKARLIEEYNKKVELYEAELEKLGVHKVDPSNPKEMEILNEMQGDMVSKSNGFLALVDRTGSDFPPNFTLVALSALVIAAFISLCRRKKENIYIERYYD